MVSLNSNDVKIVSSLITVWVTQCTVEPVKDIHLNFLTVHTTCTPHHPSSVHAK